MIPESNNKTSKLFWSPLLGTVEAISTPFLFFIDGEQLSALIPGERDTLGAKWCWGAPPPVLRATYYVTTQRICCHSYIQNWWYVRFSSPRQLVRRVGPEIKETKQNNKTKHGQLCCCGDFARISLCSLSGYWDKCKCFRSGFLLKQGKYCLPLSIRASGISDEPSIAWIAFHL